MENSTKDISKNPIGYRSPIDVNLDFEEIYITTKDQIVIFGWLVYKKSLKNKTTILYFHENAGSKKQNLF